MNTKSTNAFNPRDILSVVSRRRWYFIIPFSIILLVGIILALKLPKIYEASTLILVKPQKLPTNYVRPIISTDLDSRINTISQQIMSRSKLQKLIQQFNLFSDPGQSKLVEEQKIDLIRKKISVTLIRKRKNSPADAFSIGFKDNDPELAAKIANALTTYVIDENIKVREGQAMGTSDFLKDEQLTIKRRLEEQEKRIKEYRNKYMGGLPSQLDTNLRTLDRLQRQLDQRGGSLRDAKNRLLILNNIIEEKRKQTAGRPQSGDQSIAENVANLGRLKERLDILQMRYTPRHPDVVRLKTVIAKLEAEAGNPSTEIQKNEQQASLKAFGPEAVRRIEIENDIQLLNDDMAKIRKAIAYYQKLVDDTPRREQELLSLKRDYRNIKDNYTSILKKKLEADISVNMEKKQKGEQFRILDPAVAPKVPSEPNMKKLFGMVLFAAVAVGGGLVFLLEYLDQSFRRPEEVKSFLGLPVLSEVPVLVDASAIRNKYINRAATFVSLFLSMVLFAGFTVLTLVGLETAQTFVKQLLTV